MHEWTRDPKEAVRIQNEIRNRVLLTPLSKNIQTIAGVDVSLNRFSKDLYAGIIVLSYPSLEQIDYVVVKTETEFPYIPGLLSFREIPALLECFKKLKTKPDLVMVDGQGIAHPRRLGIASHLGVLLDIPTIGVGKSVLTGIYKTPIEVGSHSDLVDPKTGEVIGAAFQSKIRSNPLIISPGHRITISESLDFTRSCLRGYRLPEPTRRAHLLVNMFRRGEL